MHAVFVCLYGPYNYQTIQSISQFQGFQPITYAYKSLGCMPRSRDLAIIVPMTMELQTDYFTHLHMCMGIIIEFQSVTRVHTHACT